MRRVIVDIETYRNYFLIGLKELGSSVSKGLEWCGEGKVVAAPMLRTLLDGTQTELITFNGHRFDVPLLLHVCASSPTVLELWREAQRVISQDKGRWYKLKDEAIRVLRIRPRVADTIAYSPPHVSLKDMEARLKLPRLQELPVSPDTTLTPEQMAVIKDYCLHADLPATEALFNATQGRYKVREMMVAEYRDFLPLALSDAQIAEFILKPQRGSAPFRKRYAETLDDVLRDMGDEFNAFVRGFLRTTKGVFTPLPNAPKIRPDLSCKLSFGKGGIHSKEADMYICETDEYKIIDVDVASYYPTMIINGKVLGRLSEKYTELFHKRLEYKKAKDPRADIYKIVLNGTFGKLGSKYSGFFKEGALEYITITGQLQLAVLYHWLVEAGCQPVSVNTDGITFLCRRTAEAEQKAEEAKHRFEQTFRLGTETVEYVKLLHKNVNNYWALTREGELKRKGLAVQTGLQSAPNFDICSQAAEEYFLNSTPIEDTIKGCADIHMFTKFTKSTLGSCQTGLGEVLGKYLRFVRVNAACKERRTLLTAKGDSVSLGDGAAVLNDIPEGKYDGQWIKGNIDYEFYIKQANTYIKGMLNA